MLLFCALSIQAYLDSGCSGSFKDFESAYTASSPNAATDLSAVAKAMSTPGVSTPMLVAVSSACGAVALVAGFLAGQQERRALVNHGDERSPLMQSGKGGSI